MGVKHTGEAVLRIVDELENVLGVRLPEGTHVVDVGAGTGNIAIKLSIDGRFKKVTAVDISKKSLDVLEQHALAHDLNVNTIESNMLRLPFEDSSVDLLVGCAFLHHLPDPKSFMSEVNRVLKPGAPFIIICEPTYFGALLLDIAKYPLVLANRALKLFKKKSLFRWEHDHIDVHTFCEKDVSVLFKDNFSCVRICNEGFVEPVIDQSIIVPLRYIIPQSVIRDNLFNPFLSIAHFFDHYFFNKVVPAKFLVTLKVSGRKKA